MESPGPGPRRGAAAPLTRSWEVRCLGLILLAALVVRLLGVGRGLPYVHEYDEDAVLTPVIGMLQRGDLNPVMFVYPSVYYYVLLPVMHLHYLYLHALGQIASAQEIRTYHPQAIGMVYRWYINYPSFYLWGHTLTALVGTATIWLVYRLGAAAYGAAAGLLAAAFLSVAPGAVYFSDTMRVDVPMAFLAAAAMLAGLRVLTRGARLDYAAAGLLAGLAVSTKLNAAVVCAPLAIAHILNPRRPRLVDLNSLVMALGVLIGFVAGTPYILIAHDTTYAWLIAQARAYGIAPGLAEISRALPLYLGYLLRPSQGTEWYIVPHAGVGLLPGLAAAVGLAAGFRARPRVHLYLASFPVLYLLYMAGQRLVVLRSMIPLLPFAALFAGVGCVSAWERLAAGWPAARTRHAVLAGAGIAILLAGPALASFGLGWAMGHDTDSRTTAVRWLRQHARPGDRVAFETDLRWFLPDLRRLPFAILWAPRDATLGWYLQRRVDYAVVGRRSRLRGADPAAIMIHPPPYIPNPAADWPPDGYLIVDPELSIVRTAPPIQDASGALIAEPVVTEPGGGFSETTDLAAQRRPPGRYTVTVTGAWPWRWASPSSRVDLRVRVGTRLVGTTTAAADRPLRYTTPAFDVPRGAAPPVQVETVLRPADAASGWALRPEPAACAAAADAPSLNPQQLTVEAWVYLDSIPIPPRAPWRPEPAFAAPVLSKNPGAGGYLLALSANTPETVWVDFAAAGHTERAGFTSVRTWTHIAATADGRNVRIYVNGAPAPRDPDQPPIYRGAIHSLGAPLSIGCIDARIPDRWLLHGLIAQVRIWNRPLSPSEVRDEAGLGRLPDDSPGLVGSWSFHPVPGTAGSDRSPAHNDLLNGPRLHLERLQTGGSALPAWTSGGLDLISISGVTIERARNDQVTP